MLFYRYYQLALSEHLTALYVSNPTHHTDSSTNSTRERWWNNRQNAAKTVIAVQDGVPAFVSVTPVMFVATKSGVLNNNVGQHDLFLTLTRL